MGKQSFLIKVVSHPPPVPSSDLIFQAGRLFSWLGANQQCSEVKAAFVGESYCG